MQTLCTGHKADNIRQGAELRSMMSREMSRMSYLQEFTGYMAKRMAAKGFAREKDEDRGRYFGLREEWGGIEGNASLHELVRCLDWYNPPRRN